MTSDRPNPPSSGVPIGGIVGIAVLALIGLALLIYALSNVFANPAPAASATPADLGPTATATAVIVLPTTTAPPPTAAPSATTAVVDTPAVTDTPAGAATATTTTQGDLFVLVVAANVRAAPSADSELLGTIDGGSSADVIGRNEAGDWLAISFNGVTGWVSTQVASYLGDASTLPVMTSNAPAPTAAGTAAATATAQPGGAATATPAAASGNVVTANPGGANVRSAPSTTAEVVGGIDAGKTATVKGRNASSDWFAIDFNGTTAWVYSGVVTYSGNIADLPIVTPSSSTGAGTTASTSPTATAASSGSASAGTGTHGLTGKLEIDGSKLTYAVNERIWFFEELKNTTSAAVQYGVLGVEAQAASGSKILQTSLSAGANPLQIDAGCTGPTDRCGGRLRDDMTIGVAGQYRLRMVVCYNLKVSECNQSGAQWEYLTDAILITIE